jgi:hypothetical protein
VVFFRWAKQVIGWWTYHDLAKTESGRMVQLKAIPVDSKVVYLRSNGQYYRRVGQFIHEPVYLGVAFLEYGNPEPIPDPGEMVFRFNVQLVDE